MSWPDYAKKFSNSFLWFLLFISLIMLLAGFSGLNKALSYPLIRSEAPVKSDVVIVLGGGVVTDLKILPWGAQERVKLGVDLYKLGYADKMIVAGGVVKGQSYSESQFLREYAEFLGVAAEDIIEENTSRDTYENALNSLELMKSHNMSTALIVTSDYHTKRACQVFEKQGAIITCLSAPPSPAYENNYFRKLSDARSIFREYLAIIYYWIKGYI